MMGKSLRLRLALTAALSIAFVMLVAGIGLVSLFERHVERRVSEELRIHLLQLIDNLTFSADAPPELTRALPHPRFEQPLSGLYWQVEDDTGGTRLRSRSLWDHVIALPREGDLNGATHKYNLPGPNGTSLLVAERHISFSEGNRTYALRVATAIDRRDLERARLEFAEDVTISLALLALILMLASMVQIAVGLRPLDALRRHVSDIRSGQKKRIGVDEPVEIMPLVAEVNSLLEAQEQAIDRARTRAADLAHGLKTPLMVLAGDADRLRQRGETEIAEEVDELTSTMRRHIDRELSRVRLQDLSRLAPPALDLADACDRIVRVVARSPQGARLHWAVTVPPGLRVGMRREDLSELLGAILENASKWATSAVTIAAAAGNRVRVEIADDGPGTTPELLARLGRRGVRLDQSSEGSGLGLAIASDVVDAYGGTIMFGLCEPHGFKVTIDLAAA